MRQWELKFEVNEEDKVFEAAVPEEAQPLLEVHSYLGISWVRRDALQLFSREEAEAVSEKILCSRSEGRIPAARLYFRYLEMMTGPETIQIPFGLGGFLHMEEWVSLEAVLEEDEEGSMLLYAQEGVMPEEEEESAE